MGSLDKVQGWMGASCAELRIRIRKFWGVIVGWGPGACDVGSSLGLAKHRDLGLLLFELPKAPGHERPKN